jgi:hypothetical protein
MTEGDDCRQPVRVARCRSRLGSPRRAQARFEHHVYPAGAAAHSVRLPRTRRAAAGPHRSRTSRRRGVFATFPPAWPEAHRAGPVRGVLETECLTPALADLVDDEPPRSQPLATSPISRSGSFAGRVPLAKNERPFERRQCEAPLRGVRTTSDPARRSDTLGPHYLGHQDTVGPGLPRTPDTSDPDYRVPVQPPSRHLGPGHLQRPRLSLRSARTPRTRHLGPGHLGPGHLGPETPRAGVSSVDRRPLVATLAPPGVQARRVSFHVSPRDGCAARCPRGVSLDGVDEGWSSAELLDRRRWLTPSRVVTGRGTRFLFALRPMRCAFAARQPAQALLIHRMSAQGVLFGKSGQTRGKLPRRGSEHVLGEPLLKDLFGR